jgi:hypothetical protein
MALTGVFRRHAKLGAAMAADVIEPAQRTLAITNHEDGFSNHVQDQGVTGLGHLLFARNAHPGGGEEVFLFQGEDLVAKIKRRRKGRLKLGICCHIDHGS